MKKLLFFCLIFLSGLQSLNAQCTEAPIIDSTINPDFFIRSIATCNDIDNELSAVSSNINIANPIKTGSFEIILEIYSLFDTAFSNVLSTRCAINTMRV